MSMRMKKREIAPRAPNRGQLQDRIDHAWAACEQLADLFGDNLGNYGDAMRVAVEFMEAAKELRISGPDDD